MGSAVLGEAISAIRDWSVVSKKEPGDARAANLFGSLVFNDAEQEKRLPKPVYHALRRTVTSHFYEDFMRFKGLFVARSARPGG